MKSCRDFDNRRELWRSEMLSNDHDPVWKSTFVHEYRFEESQPIKIEIYDWDTSDSGVTNHLKDQDLIGRIETNMASLVSAKQYNAVLRNKANKGQLNIKYQLIPTFIITIVFIIQIRCLFAKIPDKRVGPNDSKN